MPRAVARSKIEDEGCFCAQGCFQGHDYFYGQGRFQGQSHFQGQGRSKARACNRLLCSSVPLLRSTVPSDPLKPAFVVSYQRCYSAPLSRMLLLRYADNQP